jgi:hypothetical protein
MLCVIDISTLNITYLIDIWFEVDRELVYSLILYKFSLTEN